MIESVPILVAGDRVAIGPLRQRLASLYAQWENDLELSLLRGIDPRSGVDGEAPRLLAERAESSVVFTIYETIYDSKAPRPIGIAELSEIDRGQRTARFSIFLGERDTWGTGLGSEATRLTLAFAFDSLGLFNVVLRVRADDKRAITAFERAGFAAIGVRRGAIRRGQDTLDELWMDAVASPRALTAEHDTKS